MNHFLRVPTLNHSFLFLLLVVGTVITFFPGLSGDFVFDDGANLLANDRVQIEKLDFVNLRAATFSGDAGPLLRPLSMLSFALNFYFSGFDPFYFKLVNLGIHILNGASLYIFLSLLLGALTRGKEGDATRKQYQYLALAITAAWLLHPLGVTSVLYVVQRMNSLATHFILWGLIFYLWGRLLLETGKEWKGFLLMGVGIFGFGALASLSKETGVLLPIYALVVEVGVFRFRTDSVSTRNKIVALFGIAVALPLLAVGLYIALHPDWLLDQYRIRNFTLAERLLTETRILWLYLQWIVAPSNSALGLFHDDIPLSKSLFQPLTTAFSILGLGLLTYGAYIARKRVPIVTFGIIWFLAGHSLESSFLGLEIAHEHRNYLPMVGILMIAFYMLLLVGENAKQHRLRVGTVITILLLLGVVTFLRATQWSNNVSLNLSEVEHHPDSMRANYQAGRQYTIFFERDRNNRSLYERAWYYLDRSTMLDTTSTPGLFGMIYLYELDHSQIEPARLTELKRRLNTSFFSSFELLSLQKLAGTVDLKSPALPHEDILALFDAAFENPTLKPSVKAMLLSTLSGYYANQRRSYSDAMMLALKAIEVAPEEPIFNVSFANLLLALHKKDDARAQLRIAKTKDRLGRFTSDILILEEQINDHE